MKDFLGMDQLFDGEDSVRLIVRLGIMLVFVAVVIRSYSRRHYGGELAFTYWSFSIVTFCIAFLLRKVPMELGFALGLFAVFGVLRYRTESIAIKDLTHLFVVIGLALINALANKKISLGELLIVNAVIAGGVVLAEVGRQRARESFVRVLYDKIQLLAPDQEGALLDDLRQRTGIPVTRCHVEEVDLLRDTVKVLVYFESEGPQPASATASASAGSIRPPAIPGTEPSGA